MFRLLFAWGVPEAEILPYLLLDHLPRLNCPPLHKKKALLSFIFFKPLYYILKYGIIYYHVLSRIHNNHAQCLKLNLPKNVSLHFRSYYFFYFSTKMSLILKYKLCSLCMYTHIVFFFLCNIRCFSNTVMSYLKSKLRESQLHERIQSKVFFSFPKIYNELGVHCQIPHGSV